MILDFILSLLVGYASHQTERITSRAPHGWRNLSEHTVGVVTVFPVFAWYLFRLKELQPAKRGIVAYLLAFLGYGIGNAVAWAVDSLRED